MLGYIMQTDNLVNYHVHLLAVSWSAWFCFASPNSNNIPRWDPQCRKSMLWVEELFKCSLCDWKSNGDSILVTAPNIFCISITSTVIYRWKQCCFIEQHCNKNARMLPILGLWAQTNQDGRQKYFKHKYIFFNFFFLWGKSVLHRASTIGSAHFIV